MDKILIIDKDSNLLIGLKKGLEKLQQFEVLTATDGLQAVSILEKTRVSILVTDIQTQKIGILELLSLMSRKHPNTPCIIMSSWGKPWYKREDEQEAFLYHLEKPFSLGALASAIYVGLNMRDEGTNFQGMTMTSLLPLLDLEQKTCRMQVASNDGKGYLYFDKGVLIDAHYEDLNGEAAARKIATWNRIAFQFSELPRHRHRKRVKTKIMEMANASWEKKRGMKSREDESPVEFEVIDLVDELPSEIDKAGRKRLEAEALLHALKSTEGYLSCALVDSLNGKIKTDQSLHTMDLNSVAGKMQQLFADISDSTGQFLTDTAEALTLYTHNCIFQIQPIENDQLLIGVFETNCNLNAIKQRFEEIARSADPEFFPELLS